MYLSSVTDWALHSDEVYWNYKFLPLSFFFIDLDVGNYKRKWECYHETEIFDIDVLIIVSPSIMC